MNDSFSPQTSHGPILALLEKVGDLNERLSRVEAHLQLENAPKFVKSVAPSSFAPAIPRSTPVPRSTLVPPVAVSDEVAPPMDAPLVFSTKPEPEAPQPLPQPAPSQPKFSLGEWENLIGGKWALWVGSLCLFLAMASFLAYTWKSLPPAPPWAKVAMGLASGAALLAVGGWLRTRTQRYFPEGLSGAGLAICYLSLWAGSQYFAVFSHAQSFLGMAILTALGVHLAVRYDAPSLSVLSTLGGFLTPVLLQSEGGAGQATPFLSYVALLNAGILAVSLWKRWRGLVWLSFAGTLLLVGGWALSADFPALRLPFFGFLSLYFLLFLGASCFYSLFRGENTAPEDLLLLFAATSLYSLAGFALLAPVSGAFPAAFPLGLSAFFGGMNALVLRLAPHNQSLRTGAGGLALLAVTVAVPLQFRQSALTIGWVVEAAVLVFLGGRLQSALLQRAGQIVWVLTAIPLLSDLAAPPTAKTGLWSAAALPLAICIAVSGFLGWNARKQILTSADPDPLENSYATFSVLGGAWLLAQEIYRFWELNHAAHSSQWAANAYFNIAGAAGVYSLGVFALGLKWRHQTVRWCALALAVTAALGVVAPVLSSPLGASVWSFRAVAFGVVGGVLIELGRRLHRESDVFSEWETQNAPAWTVGTACFWLFAASVELLSALSHPSTILGFERFTAAFFALSMLWNGAATLALWLSFRWRQPSLRVLASAVGSAALIALLLASLASTSAGIPFLNARGAAFVVALLSIQIGARLLARNAGALSPSEREFSTSFRFASLGLLLWTLTQESYALGHYSQAILGAGWGRWAPMLVSLVWSLFGALLLMAGIHRREQPLRLAALGLLCATVVKVFLFDLGFLSGLSRVLSLGGLGISLIFISWLYSRFGTEKAEAEKSV